METLSALDAEFLHLEDETTPYHIGGVAVFDGPAIAYDDLMAAIEAKLHLIPRYRQRIGTVPLELGRPVWLDDPHFSVRHHIFHTALPAPGDQATLERLVGRLMSHRLDRDRPLWEIWLVEGLADGRWALVFKVHHCMVDGVAGVGLLQAVLDLDPAAPLPEAPPWEPEPSPAGLARVGDAWSGLADDLGNLVRSAPGALVHPARTAQAALDAARGLVGFTRHATLTPALSVEGPIGPHRSWASSTVSLAEVKEVRGALGGTVNDVVLACVARGLRDLLLHRGDDVDGAVVRVMVPVSVRRDDGDGVPDNRVSTLLVELPVATPDPGARLAAVRAAMDDAKGSHMAELGEAIAHLADLAPPMALGTLSRLGARAMHRLPQRTVTTVATNVPGPQFPLYCRGHLMCQYLPFVPIASRVRVGTAILSYDGQVSFGVTGDATSVPEVGLVAAGAAAELAELVALARVQQSTEETP
jgi:diacylglycerol O-acyltransferase / wax synthase